MFFASNDFFDPSHKCGFHTLPTLSFRANLCHAIEQLENNFFTINNTYELHSVQ